jgi:UDP-N-acetylmuramate--alanine ligase
LDSPAGSVAVTLAVPGPLNVANAAVAAAVALATGIEPEAVAHGLGAFVGAPRRFQVVATMNETTLVDDYAHLPAEVVATVVAAQSSGYERIAAVFQPHRVTRTEALAPQFADAFDGVTELIVTDIYTAGEPNPHATTGELVADAVRGRRGGPRVTYVATLEDAAEVAAHWLGRFDLVLILGAGDVGRVIDLVRARVAS